MRGLLLAHQNVGEQILVEHPAIRGACAKNDIAIVWTNPALDMRYKQDRERSIAVQQDMLDKLAALSGYTELAGAPWITFGHSSTTIFAHRLAEARPERTIAVISAKGGFSYPEFDKYEGPVLYSGGHFPEWRQPEQDWRTNGSALNVLRAVREVQTVRFRPVSYVEEYGCGHFDFSEPYMRFLALYIERTAAYRLKSDGTLRPISPDDGYVVDMQLPLPVLPLEITRYAEAAGELRHAPFFIDRETAKGAVEFMSHSGRWQRENQIVAFARLDGSPVEITSHLVPVECEYAGDGITIKRIETTFLDELPGNFEQAGMKFGHAAGGQRTIERVSGVFDAGPDGTYRIRLNRGWPEVPEFVLVRHPGDDRFRPSVQPARFVVPMHKGRPQRIDFPSLKDCRAGTGEIPLDAKSSAGLPVYYFVRSGPAKVVDGRLVLLTLPPRARLPVKVTVTAWQLGRGGADPVSAAAAVERAFYITGNDR
ncbi:hypothetical protein OH491_06485 [Termitidicoccus mucosus]|uniref:hypothetical protein n=1 Tax=Termitidicoccus mucosus TaxID=1184151 RepID=UPI0011AB7A50